MTKFEQIDLSMRRLIVFAAGASILVGCFTTSLVVAVILIASLRKIIVI